MTAVPTKRRRNHARWVCLAITIWPSWVAAETIVVTGNTAADVQVAIASASPGDVVQLQNHTYTGTIAITSSGAPDNPIVIESMSSDPAQYATLDPGGTGGDSDRQALRISDASWIEIRNVRIANAWPAAIELREASYVSVRGVVANNTATHLVAAHDDTHHVLLEGNEWSQHENLYRMWDWAELHHGNLVHYNGGIYGGRDAAGAVVVRHNSIRFVFNGLRWWMNDAEAAQRNLQTNIEVYDNHFSYGRDNFLEPEVFTYNFHAYHNVFDNCPKGVFSIDKIDGGNFTIYGNTGVWSEADAAGDRAWTIFKFGQYEGGHLDFPLRIVHNSWNYREAFGATRAPSSKADDHLRHFNNAYAQQDNKTIGLVEWAGSDTEVDYDCSQNAFPDYVTNQGWEANGVVGDPSFMNATTGDFRLQSDSPCANQGTILDDFTLWYEGAAPDMGAYENGQRVYGWPFAHESPPGGDLFTERPRLVRIFARGTTLVFFFSTGIDARTISASALELSDDTGAIDVLAASSTSVPRAVRVDVSRDLSGTSEIDVALVALAGTNGERGDSLGRRRAFGSRSPRGNACRPICTFV